MLVNLEQALSLLQHDDVVAVPTETVYGLAARFDSPQAIEKVFALKQRPLDHPLIVHVGDPRWLDQLVTTMPAYVQRLLDAFWPGPLTLVLPKRAVVSDLITAGQNTVAVRMPAHPLLLTLLRELNTPIVAPSANRFTQTSPTRAVHVENGLGSEVPVLDGGACEVGIESTIVLATDPTQMTLLRPGIIASDTLQQVAGVPCRVNEVTAVKVPGQHQVHYQPKKPLWILSPERAIPNDQRYYCMLWRDRDVDAQHTKIMMPHHVADYAQSLYQHWQHVEQLSVDGILIELPPDEPLWQGVRDRIFKAALG